MMTGGSPMTKRKPPNEVKHRGLAMCSPGIWMTYCFDLSSHVGVKPQLDFARKRHQTRLARGWQNPLACQLFQWLGDQRGVPGCRTGTNIEGPMKTTGDDCWLCCALVFWEVAPLWCFFLCCGWAGRDQILDRDDCDSISCTELRN